MPTVPARLLQLGPRAVEIEQPFRELFYLAVPYSDPDWEIQEERYQIVTEVAAELINRGHVVFSPITHNFPLTQATRRRRGLSPQQTTAYTNFAEWEGIDKSVLQICSCMMVVAILGWTRSRGVQAEMDYANQLHIPVEILLPDKLGVLIPEHHQCEQVELSAATPFQSKRRGFQYADHK